MNLEWLKALAPTLATALGGPLAGLAVEAIGSAFDWSDATKEKVEATLKSGQLTSEQLAAVQQAEIALKSRLAELGIDLEKIHAADRDSARRMQNETKSLVPGFLAFLITAGFFGILIGMMAGGLKVADNTALLILLGALASSWGAVVNFYYGSSKSSEDKTFIMAKQPK